MKTVTGGAPSRGFDTSAFRVKITGECEHCQGFEYDLDACQDETLYGMFGGTLKQHYPGCPDYQGFPETENNTPS